MAAPLIGPYQIGFAVIDPSLVNQDGTPRLSAVTWFSDDWPGDEDSDDGAAGSYARQVAARAEELSREFAPLEHPPLLDDLIDGWLEEGVPLAIARRRFDRMKLLSGLFEGLELHLVLYDRATFVSLHISPEVADHPIAGALGPVLERLCRRLIALTDGEVCRQGQFATDDPAAAAQTIAGALGRPYADWRRDVIRSRKWWWRLLQQ